MTTINTEMEYCTVICNYRSLGTIQAINIKYNVEACTVQKHLL